MPEMVQSALLRVLERGEVQQIGRDTLLQTDVRVIAATNRNLQELMEQKRFREDLYDRLNVFQIRVPPLRERPEDIPLLASHFLRRHCREMRISGIHGDSCVVCHRGHSLKVRSPEFRWLERVGCATEEFYGTLRDYHWPGNVRELEHLLLNLSAMVQDEMLDERHLAAISKGSCIHASSLGREDLTLKTYIRNHILRVLRDTDNNVSNAAPILGFPVSTLRSKMTWAGIKLNKRCHPGSDR